MIHVENNVSQTPALLCKRPGTGPDGISIKGTMVGIEYEKTRPAQTLLPKVF